MKRKAPLILLIASALLGVATLLLWWQSYNAARYVIGYWGWGEKTRSISLGIEPGQLAIASAVKERNEQRGVTVLVRHGRIPDSMTWADESGQGEFLGFRLYSVTYTIHMINPRQETIFDIPAWFIVLLFVCTGAAAVRRMKSLPSTNARTDDSSVPSPGTPGEG